MNAYKSATKLNANSEKITWQCVKIATDFMSLVKLIIIGMWEE